MIKHRLAIYFCVVAILEKHGFDVVMSIDRRTIYATRFGAPSSGNEIVKLLKNEDLIDYLDHIEPEAQTVWKLYLI